MGQQQLLLIILVTIVVGISTIIALNVVTDNKKLADKDAVRQELGTAVVNIQTFWERPHILGGANKDFQSDGITDALIVEWTGIPGVILGSSIINENATYTLLSTGSNTIEIEAILKNSVHEMFLELERNSDGIWIYTITDGDLVTTNAPD